MWINIIAFACPCNESCSNCVSFESLKGTWRSLLASAAITEPKALRLLFMAWASFILSPVASLLLNLSLPAQSDKFQVAWNRRTFSSRTSYSNSPVGLRSNCIYELNKHKRYMLLSPSWKRFSTRLSDFPSLKQGFWLRTLKHSKLGFNCGSICLRTFSETLWKPLW